MNKIHFGQRLEALNSRVRILDYGAEEFMNIYGSQIDSRAFQLDGESYRIDNSSE